MSPGLPTPDFQDVAQNTLRDEILDLLEKNKVKYDQSIVGVVSYVPLFIDFGSFINYKPSDRATVLKNIKANIVNIIKQVVASLEKMDALNKGNVNSFMTRIVFQNIAGKASTSKKSTFYPDGTLEITTIFEDGLNCQYYLEKKIITALNEFRPMQGAVVPDKVVAFVPEPVAPPQPEPVVAAPVVPTTAGLDFSVPTYANGAWETLKLEVLKVMVPLKIDASVLPGAPFELPVSVDWSSIALSGADPSSILKSLKNNIPAISKQIIPGIQKIDEYRKPMIRDYMSSIVFQNIPGKASTLKRAVLTPEGSLMLIVPFEDSLNCSYYFEKKITTGLCEFSPVGASAPQPKTVISAPVAPQPTVVAQPAKPNVPQYSIPQTYQPQQPPAYTPVVQQPFVPVSPNPAYSIPQTYQQQPPQPAYVPVYQQPAVYQPPVVVPQPVAPPAPAVVYKEPPKEKGRPEMAERPNIPLEDATNQFYLREIETFVKTFEVIDEKDQPIGAPIYIDWSSIMVYPSPLKQNTVFRNVNLALYKILRDCIAAIKLACTDYGNRDNIVEYLRSFTVQNVQGTSSTAKKVVYEDGHLTLQTTFEDYGNCGLYIDSKVVQALGSRPSAPPAKKPDAATIAKEEIIVRLKSHQSIKNKDNQTYTPSCPIEMDWGYQSVKAYDGANLEVNFNVITNGILTDMFIAIQSFPAKEIDLILSEIKKVVFVQATPGKTIFDKRTVLLTDPGTLNITTTFEDRTDGLKSFKEKFTNCFQSRIYKVEIRDVLVPALKNMIDTAVKVDTKPNPLDNYPVDEYKSYSSAVVFDWQIVEKESLESQVGIYKSLVSTLRTESTFATLLNKAIRDICSYDVGKNAFLPCTTFILRNIMRHKEETTKQTTPNTWEFFVSFHDLTKYQITQKSLTTLFKETLKVAYPCAIQDCFPLVEEMTANLESSTGKNVPVIMHYDSWRNFDRFKNDATSYRSIDNVVIKLPETGLACIKTLCKDKIVLKEYTRLVNQIHIVYDTTDSVKGHRSQDPDVVAKLEKGILTFTCNFKDGKMGHTRGWDYQLELVLATRPLKVTRAMEKAESALADVSQQLGALIGKPGVKVTVDYQGFIHEYNFLLALEEDVYTKVIMFFSNAIQRGWISDSESSDLSSYETVKKSIQSQLTVVEFGVNVNNSQKEHYDFTLANGKFRVNMNLSSCMKGETKSWRLDLERIFKLRDLKLREEIAKRIDISRSKQGIAQTVGKPIEIQIDWESLINNPDFSRNTVDYITYIHKFSETILAEFPKPSGFGRVCEYQEVQTYVQQNLTKINLVAGSSSRGVDISYDKSSKSIEIAVGIKNLLKNVSSNASDYEEYGRKIENVMALRLMMVKGYIQRNQSDQLSSASSRITEAIENDAKVTIEWDTIIQHSGFLEIVEFKKPLEHIIDIAHELHTIVQLCRENHQAKALLKPVRQWTIVIDGRDSINESEFDDNKYGVDWAKVSWRGLPAKEHIQVTVNLEQLTRKPHNLGLHLKLEFLVTPDKALQRYQNKKEDQYRQDKLEQDARYHDQQLRMDQRMLDASNQRNRELDRLNRNLHLPFFKISNDDFIYTPLPRIPENIRYIKFSKCSFSQLLSLPPHINYLELYIDNWINVAGFIPKSITHLNIRKNNSLSIKDFLSTATIYLPSTLEQVFVEGEDFVKRIKIVKQFQYYHNNVKFKSQLKKLVLPETFSTFIPPNSLPPSLLELRINDMHARELPLNALPHSLEVFDIRYISSVNVKSSFPSTLSSLKIVTDSLDNIKMNTEAIKELDLYTRSAKICKEMKNVKKLRISTINNQELISVFPSLEDLTIENEINNSLIIPRVKNLTFSNSFGKDIVIPDSVKNLKVGKETSLLSVQIPKSIEKIGLNFSINQKLLLLNNGNLNNAESNDYSSINHLDNHPFIYIWRNKYLKSKIINSLINPSTSKFQTPLIVNNNTLFINDLLKIKQIIGGSICLKGIKEITTTNECLSTLGCQIPYEISKLFKEKVFIYQEKDNNENTEIPFDTKVLVWNINQAIPIGLVRCGVNTIVFGNSFNQTILKDSIPNSVSTIHFGQNFNQDLNYIYFPNNLKYLYFGKNFDQKIRPKRIPHTLKHIGFDNLESNNTAKSLFFLHDGVDHLYLKNSQHYIYTPPSIKFVKIVNHHSTTRISNTIQCVTTKHKDLITFIQNPCLTKDKKTKQEKLNPSIHLDIFITENQFIHPNLFDFLIIKSICFDDVFDQLLLPGCLPNTLESIEFGSYNRPIKKEVFPKSLKRILFHKSFNQAIDCMLLPNSLTELHLGESFNQPIDKKSFPNSLTTLAFGKGFDQELSQDMLPNSLTKLSFGSFYHNNLLNWLPSSVTDLSVGNLEEPPTTLFPLRKLAITSVTKLWLGDSLIIESPNLIPSVIKEIRLCQCNIIEPIPHTLESLVLSKYIVCPLDSLINNK
ncbi:hypothetical protein CYY_006265 [Polysphondylium violaceum]|uniref:Uncharacterized protein n=1 Tax=Polysphondylium violaceum TaxID=133409 RepID=A0A8J4PQT9_9MYCE|nr:hypothetical protein CYY_006265 [Polysphondylium violaceum]